MDKSKVSPISLKDLMPDYELESYLSGDDISLIRNTFKDRRVMKVLRKVFLPVVSDIDMPIEEMVGKDVWNVGKDWASVPAEHAKALITARQEAIKFIVDGMLKLKALAATKEETEAERNQRQSKNSSK